jgi:uncharacterized membrane protein YhaH (DUF805 family)
MSYGTPPPPPPGEQPPYGGQPPYGSQPPPYGQPYGQQPFGPANGDPGTLDLPWYGIGFGAAVARFFSKYARFDGRASRGEYWWSALGVGLVFLVLYVVATIAAASNSTALASILFVLVVVFSLAVAIPSIAIAVRRLHDGGFSGWFYLLGFIPIVGGIITLVLMCLPPKPEGARYDRPSARPAGGGTGAYRP